MSTLGENLRKYRLFKGISQCELGNMSGVSRNYISEIESGTYSNISLLIICKLCKALVITPNDLIPEKMYK